MTDWRNMGTAASWLSHTVCTIHWGKEGPFPWMTDAWKTCILSILEHIFLSMPCYSRYHFFVWTLVMLVCAFKTECRNQLCFEGCLWPEDKSECVMHNHREVVHFFSAVKFLSSCDETQGPKSVFLFFRGLLMMVVACVYVWAPICLVGVDGYELVCAEVDWLASISECCRAHNYSWTKIFG